MAKGSFFKSTSKSRKPRAAAAGGGKRPPGNGKKLVRRKARDKEFSISKGLYDGRAMPQQDYDKLMANRKRLSKSKKKDSTTGGALFNQQGVSKKGKSRVGEDSDLLAGDSLTRRRAEKLEKRSMVSDPQYPKMQEVGSRGEKVTEGGQKTLNAIAKRRKINEKSIKDAQKAQEKIKKEIQNLEKQVKAIAKDKSKTPAQRVADGLKVKNRIKDKKSLLQQARDKEANAKGKNPKKSPRIPRTEMKSGGKITKRKYGGNMSKPESKKITYKRGGGMIGNKGVMYGYKSGGQV
jgi:hypothetical protein